MAGWDQNFRFHFPIYFFCFRFLFVLFIPPHYFLSTNLTYPRSMLVKSVCVCVCKDVEWQVFSICINLILTHTHKNKQIHPYTEKKQGPNLVYECVWEREKKRKSCDNKNKWKIKEKKSKIRSIWDLWISLWPTFLFLQGPQSAGIDNLDYPNVFNSLRARFFFHWVEIVQ